MKKIFRYEVPVDDRTHMYQCSEPLHVGARQADVVEFWAYPDDVWMSFRVIGTGGDVPDDAKYCGTTVSPGGVFVWHLLWVV